MKKINCPLCEERFNKLEGLYSHIEEDHEDNIPEGYSVAQYMYYIKTGKTHGNCVMCKNETGWNETTGKYKRFCENPKCKDQYREMFKERMVGKYGKTTLLNEPEQQRKMLANRHISGEYEWTDGSKKTYTGSYELDFLKMLDAFMNFDSSDIMTPSPHTYYYTYEGEKKFYIPDVYIPSLNLEIEIKDGGDNPNNHSKIVKVDKVKERLKDDVMKSQKDVDYIKIVNKNYDGFFKYLLDRKEKIANAEDVNFGSIIRESLLSVTEDFVEVENNSKEYRVCKSLVDEWDKFDYGVPINGRIKDIPPGEDFARNYRFLSPNEFKRYGGGVCWDFVAYGAEYLKKNNIKFRQFFIETNTPPNYDTHTFLVVDDHGVVLYPESSFGKIAGVHEFISIEYIFKFIANAMYTSNNNDKKFKKMSYTVYEFNTTAKYGCSCEEYMEHIREHGDVVYSDIIDNSMGKKLMGMLRLSESMDCGYGDCISEGWFDTKKLCIESPVETDPAISEILHTTLNSGHHIWVATDWHLWKFNKKKKEICKNDRFDNIILNVKDCVNKDDVLIYLGDLVDDGFQDKELLKETIQSLPGIKILIKGNNDLFDDNFYKECGFIYTGYKLLWEGILFSHMPVENEYRLNCHGHIHGRMEYWIKYSNQVDAYCDDGQPVDLLEMIRRRKEYGEQITEIVKEYSGIPSRAFDKALNACRDLYKEWSKYDYGIPVNGKIENVPSAEYFEKNYKFLSPSEFKRVGGGVCWDFVEFGSEFLEKRGVAYRQLYIITDTPPNYDTHTILVCEVDGEVIYVESSFGIIADEINGVGVFKSIEDVVEYITSVMFECNGNRKRFSRFNYDVYEFTSVPRYGSSCHEYMDWMQKHGRILHQGIAYPRKNKQIPTIESYEFVEERYIISEKDLELNLDKWAPGTPLWITGTSGDGKSTLARKLADEHNALIVPTDTLLIRVFGKKKKWDKIVNGDNEFTSERTRMAMEFCKLHPEYPYDLMSETNSTIAAHVPGGEKYWNAFFTWVINTSKHDPRYKDKLIIIEGCDISNYDPKYLATQPLIIIGGSKLRTSIRRIKRDMGDKHNIIDSIFREIRRRRDYIDDLDKERDTFRAEIVNVKESYEPVTEVSNKLRDLDQYFDFERFVNGDTNRLFITGLAGSSKQEMGRDLSNLFDAEFISLDLFTKTTINMMINGEYYGSAPREYVDLIVTFAHKNIAIDPENANKVSQPTDDNIVDFINQLIKSLDPKKRYIIEGVYIYRYYEQLRNIVSKESLIITHDSFSNTLKKYGMSSMSVFFNIIYDETTNPKKWYEAEKIKLNKFAKEIIEYRADTNNMQYSDDVYPVYVVLLHSGQMLANIIKSVTGDEFSHACISFDPSLRNMMSFGRQYTSEIFQLGMTNESIVNAVYKKPLPFALYVTFVDVKHYKAMKKTAYQIQSRGHELKYNFSGLFKYALGLPAETANSMFCSEFVATVLNSDGHDMTDGLRAAQVRPESYKYMSKFQLVQKGIITEYDMNETIKRVNRMSKK